MAQSNDALSVEDVVAASGGMQGLKDVLSTVVHDAWWAISSGIHPHLTE